MLPDKYVKIIAQSPRPRPVADEGGRRVRRRDRPPQAHQVQPERRPRRGRAALIAAEFASVFDADGDGIEAHEISAAFKSFDKDGDGDIYAQLAGVSARSPRALPSRRRRRRGARCRRASERARVVLLNKRKRRGWRRAQRRRWWSASCASSSNRAWRAHLSRRRWTGAASARRGGERQPGGRSADARGPVLRGEQLVERAGPCRADRRRRARPTTDCGGDDAVARAFACPVPSSTPRRAMSSRALPHGGRVFDSGTDSSSGARARRSPPQENSRRGASSGKKVRPRFPGATGAGVGPLPALPGTPAPRSPSGCSARRCSMTRGAKDGAVRAPPLSKRSMPACTQSGERSLEGRQGSRLRPAQTPGHPPVCARKYCLVVDARSSIGPSRATPPAPARAATCSRPSRCRRRTGAPASTSRCAARRRTRGGRAGCRRACGQPRVRRDEALPPTKVFGGSAGSTPGRTRLLLRDRVHHALRLAPVLAQPVGAVAQPVERRLLLEQPPQHRVVLARNLLAPARRTAACSVPSAAAASDEVVLPIAEAEHEPPRPPP